MVEEQDSQFGESKSQDRGQICGIHNLGMSEEMVQAGPATTYHLEDVSPMSEVGDKIGHTLNHFGMCLGMTAHVPERRP